LGVNAFDKVVTAEGYNQDGELILSGTDVIGSDLDDAVSTLISSAADNGFVAEDGSTVISLTSETDDAEEAAELTAEAQDGANEALEETGAEAVIEKDNVALERRDEARALQITPGKLNLIEKLMAADPTATVDQYKGASVKEIMYQTKVAKGKGNVANKQTQEEAADTSNTTTGQEETAAGISSETQDSSAATLQKASTEVKSDAALQDTKKNDSESIDTEKNADKSSIDNKGNSNKGGNGKKH